MNLHLQPRTDSMLRHPRPHCASSDPHGHYPRLTAQAAQVPKLTCHHQLPGQELSKHQSFRPDGGPKQLRPIQLP